MDRLSSEQPLILNDIDFGLTRLGNVVQLHPELRELKFGEGCEGLTPDQLCDAHDHLSRLTSIAFAVGGAKLVGAALKACPSLTHLDLRLKCDERSETWLRLSVERVGHLKSLATVQLKEVSRSLSLEQKEFALANEANPTALRMPVPQEVDFSNLPGSISQLVVIDPRRQGRYEFGSLPDLEELQVDADLNLDWSRLAQLRTLRLRSLPGDMRPLVHYLQETTALTTLSLPATQNLMIALGKAPLTELSLTRVGGLHFEWFAGHYRGLQVLELRQSPVSGESLKDTEVRLEQLREFNCPEGAITDDGLRELVDRFPHLEVARIGPTKLTEGGVGAMSRWKDLKQVVFSADVEESVIERLACRRPLSQLTWTKP